MATREDVGTPKAYCLKKHFSLIYPECQIEARVQLYDSSAEDEILSGQPDFVLDCIDNIDTKVNKYCLNNSDTKPDADFFVRWLALALHTFCVFLQYSGVCYIFHVVML